MILDFILFSYHNFRSRKIRTFLTMLGIFIGIAAVVSLISISAGLEKAIIGQFSGLGTDKLVIQAAETGFGPPGSTAVKKLTEKDFNAIKKVKGVKLAAKRYIRTASLEFENKLNYMYASTLPQDDSRQLVIDAMKLKTVQGRMLKKDDKYKVLIGNDLYSKEIFPKKIQVRDKVLINNIKFEVIGVLDKLGNPQFNSMFLLNEDVFKEILNIGDEIDIIAVQVSNQDEIPVISKDLAKELRSSRNVVLGKEDFTIETPQQAISSLKTILNVIQAVIIGIAAISLVVGGIGIMNTMYTSVLERTKEIGIMKSIGAKNSDILIIFLIESGILGLIGGLIGIILGISFSKLIEISSSMMLGPGILQASFSSFLILGSLSFSFFIGIISGVLPAKQASELQPVEALRK